MTDEDKVLAIVDHMITALRSQPVREVPTEVAREALLMLVATQVGAFGLTSRPEIYAWGEAAGERIAEQMLGLLEITQ